MLTKQIIAVAIGIIAISGVFWTINQGLPKVIDQTDEVQNMKKKDAEEKLKKDADAKRSTLLETENSKYNFAATNEWNINMKIGVDSSKEELKLKLFGQAAPRTVESFVRLTDRKYFNGVNFHRIVKEDTFAVIQGGDPAGTGAGGESAFGSTLPDEIWDVKPEYGKEGDQKGKLINEPKLRYPSLYKDFNKETGTIMYPKGELIMAKTQAPDSAGSQFFITLTDTTLPAQYTAFGTVDTTSLPVLDTIKSKVGILVDPTNPQANPKDGKPDKLLKIDEVSVVL
jgi:cyclophilin family peptidyl-prolyl cis-trans isomerase